MRLIDKIWQFHKQQRVKNIRHLFTLDSSSTTSSSSATVAPPPPSPKHTKRFAWLSPKRWLPSTTYPASAIADIPALSPQVDMVDHDLLCQCIQLALAPTEINEPTRPKRWSMGMIEGNLNMDFSTMQQRRRSIVVKCPPTSCGRFLTSIPEVENDL